MLFFSILPVFSFAAIEDVPKGYIYFGIKPDREKVNAILQKTVTPQILPALTEKINAHIRNELGFDFLNESPKGIGINPDKYIEVFFNPNGAAQNDLYFSIPVINANFFLNQLRQTLKKKWGAFSETSLENGLKIIKSKNPKYSTVNLCYKTGEGKIFFAASARILQEKDLLERETDHNFMAKLDGVIAEENPFVVFYMGESLAVQLSESALQMGIAVTGDIKKNELEIGLIYTNDNKIKLEHAVPGFLKDNPILLISSPIDKEELLKISMTKTDLQIQELLKILNLKESLGNGIFLTVDEINYLELAQGIMTSSQIFLGFEIKDHKPYLALMDTMLGANSDRNRAVRTIFQDVPVYSIQDLDFGTNREIHVAVLKDYVFISFNMNTIKKNIVAAVQKKQKILLPVNDKNLLMFFDAVSFFKRVPLAPLLIQRGIAADNIKWIVARISDEQKGLIRLNINLVFNR